MFGGSYFGGIFFGEVSFGNNSITVDITGVSRIQASGSSAHFHVITGRAKIRRNDIILRKSHFLKGHSRIKR